MKQKFLLLLFLLLGNFIYAQNGVIKGRVYNVLNNEPIMFANVVIQGTTTGVTTDLDGNYEFVGLEPDIYNIEISYIGFKTKRVFEIEVTNSKPAIIDVALEENSEDLKEVVVKASPFNKSEESPLSLRTIGVSEIQRSPGGNRDISQVVQNLPGVTTTASFRNDLLIRGGAPNENRFYLDDVEVPNINHFATQGASGGPVGLINVDFIREVDFYSGAFPANRGNSLSSVFNFKQKDGRDDRLGFRGTLGASDLALTLEGPIGEKTTFLLSTRRSYLQFLFKALELPFLPVYNDFQAKVKVKFDQKNELTFIGLGAIDDFQLNLDANETEEQQFLLDNLPVYDQWNYTNGLVYKRYQDNGYWTVVLSRNMLNNESVKYENNDDSDPDNLILDYKSQEIENKFRVENTSRMGSYKLNYGVNYELARYNNRTFNRISLPDGSTTTINFSSDFNMNKYGAFAQVSRNLLDDKLVLSLGARIDGNDYSDDMSNPLKQFSPRFSATYGFNDRLSFNFNTGIYYQLPAYTVLGYQEDDILVNKQNNVTYVENRHLVAGLEYQTSTSSKVTIEGYYKKYNNYPFLLRDSITLANLGGDFGVIGNAPVGSIAEGQTYGLELLYQQKLFKGFYGIAAYTLGVSQFDDKNGNYIPSSWDARHIVNLTAGKRFGKDWEIGVKWRYQSGLPLTPFSEVSGLVGVWNLRGQGTLDYNQLNALRQQGVHEMDIRVDKKWFFDKWSLNLYIDVQNVYGYSIESQVLVLDRDDTGMPQIVNPTAPFNEQRYALKTLTTGTGTILPTLGVVVEF